MNNTEETSKQSTAHTQDTKKQNPASMRTADSTAGELPPQGRSVQETESEKKTPQSHDELDASSKNQSHHPTARPKQPVFTAENAQATLKNLESKVPFSNNPRKEGIPSAQAFERPLDIPQRGRMFVGVLLIVAVLIGIFLFININTYVIHGPEVQAQKVNQVLARGVSLELPQLAPYAGESDDTIRTQLSEAGYQIYDNSSEADVKAGGMDLVKIPSDMTPEQVGKDIKTGVSNLSSEEAAKLLSGCWRMLTNRSAGFELKLRYVDFSANDPGTAINNAIATQGWDPAVMSTMKTDTAGNSTVSSSFESGDGVYYYTISACDLSHLYTNIGLPQKAQYIGIRVSNF